MDILVASLAQMEGVNYGEGDFIPIITPYEIFFNKYKLLDINFFDLTSVDEGSTVYMIRSSVATWFYAMRLIASAILLVILIYVGIRMAISTVAEDKAKYKKMLFDWICSLALIYVLQYIAIFTIYCNNAIVNALSSALSDLSAVEDQVGNILLDIGLKAVGGIGITSMAAVLVFCFIVFQTIAFLIAYISRMVKIGFLIIISPLISLTYSIDKMGDGKAQALGKWLKEYVYTILIQPFHCVMYMAFVRTALTLLVDTSAVTVLGIPLLESPEYNQLANGVLAILCLKFINDGEKVVRKIFGFQDDNSATSFGAGLAVGMLAINNAKKIGTSTRKGLNTISKATGKYGNRFKNGLNTMTPNFQLGSKIESLSKNVKNAPTNAQNAIKGKFKNYKAGQKLSKLKNNNGNNSKNNQKDSDKKSGNTKRKITGFIKRHNSLSSTLGMMAAAAAYSTGSTNLLTAVGIGSGVSKGAKGFLGSSSETLAKEGSNDNAVEDQKEFDRTIGKEMEDAEKNLDAIENSDYRKIVDNYKSADAHDEKAREARARADELRKEMESRPKGKDKGKYEKQIVQLERKATKEENMAKDCRERAGELDKDGTLKKMYDEGKLTSGGTILDQSEVRKTEQDRLSRLNDQKQDFFSVEKTKARILERKNKGSTTSDLNAKKNNLIQKLQQMKLESKRKSDTNQNYTLTTQDNEDINRTAELLMNNISRGVLAGEGYDSINESAHLDTIRTSLGLEGDLSAFSSYQDVVGALSDFDSAKRNQRTAQIFKNNSSLNGTDNSLAERMARKTTSRSH